MTIPQGSAYSFIVTINAVDSFLPQDLTAIDLANTTFTLYKAADLCTVTAGTTTITVIDAINGRLQVDLDETLTSSLTYERGDKVDGYYLKPVYQGKLTVKFTDSTPTRNAIVEGICVAPTGVTCV